MSRAKSPRTPKTKIENKILEMPEKGNGHNGFLPADLEAEIRIRAYERYEQRGRTPGLEEEDWLSAEREVLARHASQSHTA
jgi:Protein of unknown function (DUF2934)